MQTVKFTSMPYSCPLRTLCHCMSRDSKGTVGCFIGRTGDFKDVSNTNVDTRLTSVRAEQQCLWANSEDASDGMAISWDFRPSTPGLSYALPALRTPEQAAACSDAHLADFRNPLCQTFSRTAMCPTCSGGAKGFTIPVMRSFLKHHHSMRHYLESLWMVQRTKALIARAQRLLEHLQQLKQLCDERSGEVISNDTLLIKEFASLPALPKQARQVSYTLPPDARSKWQLATRVRASLRATLQRA